MNPYLVETTFRFTYELEGDHFLVNPLMVLCGNFGLLVTDYNLFVLPAGKAYAHSETVVDPRTIFMLLPKDADTLLIHYVDAKGSQVLKPLSAKGREADRFGSLLYHHGLSSLKVGLFNPMSAMKEPTETNMDPKIPALDDIALRQMKAGEVLRLFREVYKAPFIDSCIGNVSSLGSSNQ